jgi:hypothetical protein
VRSQAEYVSMFPERVLSLIAGKLATTIHHPRVADFGHSSDYEDIKSLRPLSKEALAMRAWWADNPSGNVSDFVAAFQNPVDEILRSRQGRRAVLALGRELDRHRLLSGRRTAEILSSSWGSPPPPLAMPISCHFELAGRSPGDHVSLIAEFRGYVSLMQHEVAQHRGTGSVRATQQRHRITAALEILKDFLED